jgi:HEAT repeat protein
MLTDDDWGVRAAAASSIGMLKAKDRSQDLLPLLRDRNVRGWAALALIELGETAAVLLDSSLLEDILAIASYDMKSLGRVRQALKALGVAEEDLPGKEEKHD